jgi:hypothetical protein
LDKTNNQTVFISKNYRLLMKYTFLAPMVTEK